MFATKECERLYLSNWQYNMILILQELARIVETAGGRVKHGKSAIISNRSVTSNTRELKQKLERLEELDKLYGQDPKRSELILETRDLLEEYNQFDNTPIEVCGQSWINFVLGDRYYYYSFDDNPFCSFHYRKTPVNERNEYCVDCYVDVDAQHWERGKSIWDWKLSVDDRIEIAQAIFDMLVSAKDSGMARQSRRVRVPNTYDSGYHYENVPEKVRYSKIDF